MQFVQEDNALLSFKRGKNDKLLYNKTFNLELENENANNFSYTIGFQNLIQSPAGTLHFNKIDYNDTTGNSINEIETSSFNLLMRYAPHEKFYQGKTYRTAKNSMQSSNKSHIFCNSFYRRD